MEQMELRGRVGNPPYGTTGTREGGRRKTIPERCRKTILGWIRKTIPERCRKTIPGWIRERQGFAALQSHVRELLSEYQRITSF
jgi:hypothetical protein